MSISQLNAQQSLRATMTIAAMRSNAAAVSAAPTSGSGTTRQPDAVSLSDAARALSAATKSIGDASDVREDRVSAIKAAIANGTYSVDSRQLARSMVKTLAG
jgi:negative regulator of flagellin synthesis FlgM